MPALAVLTDEEKVSIRHHLGYLQTSPVVTIFMGFPAATQTSFLVETAMDYIPAAAVGLIRDEIADLDRCEREMREARFRLSAKSVDQIDLNDKELDQRKADYVYWAKKLAADLGVPVYAYADMFRFGGGPQPMNISVALQ